MDSSKANIIIDLGQLDKNCFIVMPFNPLFATEYERIIRPAVEEIGLRCVRGDEIYSRPRIMDDIWKHIRSSRLVIAELTGKNPNVFYEVGLAQAIGKPVIIITRDENDVPFDLKALRYLYYDVQNPFWGEDLKTRLKAMIQNVLNENSLSAYLEGITASNMLAFPEPEIGVSRRNSDSIVQALNVAGVWRTSYELIDRGISSGTRTLNLTQDGRNLSGVEVNVYFRDGTPTVVEETLSGVISDTTIKLIGVNYTFIQKGQEEDYFLDNYEFVLSDEGTTMKGYNNDGGKTGIQDLVYKKFTGEAGKALAEGAS
jgi:hypothetical protein